MNCRVLAQCPELFTEIWHKSATRSTSIKLAFGIAENESPMQNAAFLGLSSTIQAFFYKLVSLSSAGTFFKKLIIVFRSSHMSLMMIKWEKLVNNWEPGMLISFLVDSIHISGIYSWFAWQRRLMRHFQLIYQTRTKGTRWFWHGRGKNVLWY